MKRDKKIKEEQPTREGSGTYDASPGIKMKIRLGNNPTTETDSYALGDDILDPSQMVLTDGWNNRDIDDGDVSTDQFSDEDGESLALDANKLTASKRDSETSDEEKEWLEALEAGNLDDSGAVAKGNASKPLTARQRARLHGREHDELLALPSGTRELTAEQKQAARVSARKRNKKRIEQAQKKEEKLKQDTLQRLLGKQDTRKAFKNKLSKRSQMLGYRYLCTASQITVSIPENCHNPYITETAPAAPTVKLCGVAGCENLRKYSCSKTGVSLCSLSCYKKNLSSKLS